MCGIVGAIAEKNIVPVLLDGLFCLEYRGYDSAGLVITNNGLQRLRTAGRVVELEKKLPNRKPTDSQALRIRDGPHMENLLSAMRILIFPVLNRKLL